jgi:hypothetical protein
MCVLFSPLLPDVADAVGAAVATRTGSRTRSMVAAMAFRLGLETCSWCRALLWCVLMASAHVTIYAQARWTGRCQRKPWEVDSSLLRPCLVPLLKFTPYSIEYLDIYMKY